VKVRAHEIRRARCDGHLRIRGLVERELIEEMRESVLLACLRRGWCHASGAPRVAPPPWSAPAWSDFLAEVMTMPAFAALRDESRIREFASAILGEEASSGAGDTCRVVPPKLPGRTTQAHQDRHYLGAGPPRWIAWVALTDCPLECGPLAFVPGSHQGGLHEHDGERGLREVPREGWSIAPVQQGDVLFFSDLTIHRALPNCTGQHRLSLDFRYARARVDHPLSAA
jgi:hypothetical protein